MSSKYTETQRRLYDAAESFYFVGHLTTLWFDASLLSSSTDYDSGELARRSITDPGCGNYLGAPPVVNFGFSIELYIKLLLDLSGSPGVRGHNSCNLFKKLEGADFELSSMVIKNFLYSDGCREKFSKYMKDISTVFEDWRYAHEKDFLVVSTDTLSAIANSFRKTIRQRYADLPSSFVRISN